jgi:dTDP-4-dehydrorhamnose 3,5-epimerase
VSRFTIVDLPLHGLKRVERAPIADSRGFLSRIFCAHDLAEAGWTGPVAQINHSCTLRAGSVRGLHYQAAPHAEMKLVTCLRGAVWDVAIDIRAGSPTFLAWHGETLSADNHRALLIPPGFAHGFQTLTDEVELLYCHSAAHAPGAEGALNVLDPRFGIAWPQPIGELSERDRNHPHVLADFEGVRP